MDLSSSRASSPVQRSDVDVITASIHDEPAIIGAWPSTPADASESPDDSVEPEHIRTPEPSSSLPSGLIPPEVIEISDDDYGTPFVPPRPDSVLDVVIEEIEGFNQESASVELPDFVVMKDNFLAQVESIGEASARMQELTDCTEVRDVRANIPEQTADIIVSTLLSRLIPTYRMHIDESFRTRSMPSGKRTQKTRQPSLRTWSTPRTVSTRWMVKCSTHGAVSPLVTTNSTTSRRA